jgi:hypothetical protein
MYKVAGCKAYRLQLLIQELVIYMLYITHSTSEYNISNTTVGQVNLYARVELCSYTWDLDLDLTELPRSHKKNVISFHYDHFIVLVLLFEVVNYHSIV